MAGRLDGKVAIVTGAASVIFTASELALDLAESGVRVNCICPGAVDTPMLWGEENANREEAEANTVDRMPLGRVGQPDEVARSALYLASDDSSFVTGHALVVDGGWTVR